MFDLCLVLTFLFEAIWKYDVGWSLICDLVQYN